MESKQLHGSFNAGEISPELFTRPDLRAYQFGAAKARNWITKPSGSAQLRPGFEIVSTLDNKARAVTFKIDGDDVIVTVEAGKFRFWQNGLPVPITGGVNDVYEIGNQDGNNIDMANDLLYTQRPHDFVDDEEVILTSTGTPPGGTATIFDYEVKSRGHSCVNLENVGTDTLVGIGPAYNSGTLYLWKKTQMRDYEPPVAISGIDAGPGDYGYQINGSISFGIVSPSSAIDWPVGTAFKWTVTGAGVAPQTFNYDSLAIVAYDDRTMYIRPESEVHPLTGNEVAIEQFTPSSSGTGTGISPIYWDGISLPYTPPVYMARRYEVGDVLFLRSAIGTFSAGDVIRCTVQHFATATITSANWTNVTSNGVPWLELSNDFTEADLFELTYAQSENKIRFAHPDHPTVELTRNTNGTWSSKELLAATSAALAPSAAADFGAVIGISSTTTTKITLNAESGLGAGDLLYFSGNASTCGVTPGYYICGSYTASGPDITTLMDFDGNSALPFTAGSGGGSILVLSSTARTRHRYIVTALDEKGREFLRSEPTEELFNPLSNAEAFNTITWTETAEAVAYRIYKEEDGTELFGFVAETGASGFQDRNIEPDYGRLAPEIDAELATNYPAAVGFYDQRGVFGGPTEKPQTLWLSALGRDNELVTRLNPLDTDRIKLDVFSLEGQTIRHVVPVNELLILTTEAAWRLTTNNTDTLTPDSATIRPQLTQGASYVRPVVMDNSVLFATRGQHVRRLSYQLGQDSFGGIDLSVRAGHLFDDHSLTDSAFQTMRTPVAWFTNSNGDLLGLTFSAQEEVAGWHQHNYAGRNFVSVACANEGDDDRLYAVVEKDGAYLLVRQQPTNIRSVHTAAHLDDVTRWVGTEDSAASLTVTGNLTVGGTARISSGSTSTFSPRVVGERIFFPAEGLVIRVTSRVDRTEIRGEIEALGSSTPTAASEWGVTRSKLFTKTTGSATALLQAADGSFETATLTIGSDGWVDLPYSCRAVHIGQLYSNELRTMPFVGQLEAAGIGKSKSIDHVHVQLFETAGLSVGPDAQTLSQLFPDDYTLRSENARELIESTWSRTGQVSFVQQLPLPATVAGVTLDVNLGG